MSVCYRDPLCHPYCHGWERASLIGAPLNVGMESSALFPARCLHTSLREQNLGGVECLEARVLLCGCPCSGRGTAVSFIFLPYLCKGRAGVTTGVALLRHSHVLVRSSGGTS